MQLRWVQKCNLGTSIYVILIIFYSTNFQHRRNVICTKLDNKADEIRWQNKEPIYKYTYSALGFYFTWRYWIDSLKLIPLKCLHMCLFIKMFLINLFIHRTSQPNEITSRPNALILSTITVMLKSYTHVRR